jgi:hypothetical protein
VPLANSKEVHDVEIKTVQDFYVRRRLVKEHLGASCKRLDVGDVIWKKGYDLGGKTVLAANVR